ncbi:family 2A encapsulin nanocompartment cargo protein cysteine desulfurase [Cellvibrio mixtus]|uniref:family 2A encapsulin nanocompartment cargo protein cysteine desulfurase n=1 Tax=Cellvibrio mixtus TaxID=39650 RepID=UPI000587CC8C|nr:family 2A encapsulin nanocompartment cargo protein cysteine desulfurase [Cellvibrio mixtus]
MSEYPEPSGLPDLENLASLANEMFQALPNAAPFFAGISGLQAAPNAGGHPAARPQAGVTSAPPPMTSPAVERHASAAPNYYFAENANQYPLAPIHLEQLISQVEQTAAQVSPQAFGLPGEADLRELLGENRFVTQAPAAATRPAAPDLKVPHALESHVGNYHQPQSVGSDRVAAQSLHLPGESDIQQLLAAEFSVTRFDAPASAATPAPDSRFYFLDSGAQPVFGNTLKTNVFAAEQQGFDVNAIRRDFPILAERVNGKPLVWFDNAATTHKPKVVIDRISYFYEHENSNIHRAAHELAARATDAYEGARNKVAKFINARSADDIIFVRGTTEGINLIANTFGKQRVGEGDEIIVSQLEHHANIVPWYLLAQRVGAKIRVIPVDDNGQILLDEYRKLINSRTKIISVTQVSNALGTVTPIKEIIDIGHSFGVPVIVDGAQSVSHMRVNVQALDADFFVFSGHKIFGPTGIGVVYGKAEHLQHLEPWQGGGNMIADVTFERVVFQGAPNRFEAGTGNIADAVGLGAALDYVDRVGIERIARYEHDLLDYATHRLRPIPGVRIIGTAADKASVLSFTLAGYKTEEVGAELNREGIAVRSGHHCAQPILRRFGVEATVRPSFAFYNTCEEIDLFISVVQRLASARRN